MLEKKHDMGCLKALSTIRHISFKRRYIKCFQSDKWNDGVLVWVSNIYTGLKGQEVMEKANMFCVLVTNNNINTAENEE